MVETAAEPVATQRPRTFRDPAGWVELHPDAAYRFIYPDAQVELLDFLATPLADRLVTEGRLNATEVLGRRPRVLPNIDADLLVLRHPLIPFVSYPWEWAPAQWLAAAELTLSLCRELLSAGWILKDATPLNVLFRGSEPVLVDVASVARLDAGVSIWYPYSQFVRTFLLPMLAYTELGWPLRTSLLRRDGLEPEDLYASLSIGQRLRQPALSAVTLPVLLSRGRKKGAEAVQNRPARRDPELVLHVLQQTLAKLGKQMRRAMPKPRTSRWSTYAGCAAHYSEADHAAKRTFVADVLDRTRPTFVLDVGANAGVYSELASAAGASVVAIDTDLETLDRLQTRLQNSGKPILPMTVDLANPTPGAGWFNQESTAFLARAAGRFDGVLMLAVLHHLLLHDHIPMSEVANLAALLTTRHLVIEWVPPTDPMFRDLVRGRDAIFAHLTEPAFRSEFGQHFVVRAERALSNGRILLHMERHGS